MHGAHNDFAVVDARTQEIGNLADAARRICDRREGVGADGLIVIASAPACR